MKQTDILLITLLFSFSGILQAQLKDKAAKSPNILLFHADDMTWRDCEPYGNTDVMTPTISRLAEEGMCFDNMHTSTAMCAPTRMQLYTGMFPARTGAYPNHSMVYDGVQSMVQHFNKLDYRVALIGKVHHEPFRSFPFEFLGGRHHDNGDGIDIDLERIKPILKQEKPFFLVVSSNQPHSPWNRGPVEQYDKNKITVPEYMIDCEKTRNDLIRYYAEISYTDSLLGVCLDYLEEVGKTENTIVIFTSEQGSSFPFAKWTCYDLGLKTSFVLKWPGKVKAGTRNNALTQYVDVVPTLLEAVGADPEKIKTGIKKFNEKDGFDGQSFLKILQGKTQEHREYVYGIQTTRGIYSGSVCYPIRSVRNNQYKYILNLNSGSDFYNMVNVSTRGIYNAWLNETSNDPERQEFVTRYQTRPKEELYDILNDPYELNNLIGNEELEPVKNELRKELAAWMNEQGDEGINTEMRALKRQPGRKENVWTGHEEQMNSKILK